MSRSSLVPTLPSEFKKSSYWESFFKKRVKSFEWYGTYYDLCSILHRYIKTKDQILMAGCGNSELSENLYDNGLKKIKNIDISKTVINQMNKRKNGRDEMEYLQMDLLDLKFDDEAFSVIVDKGTLDAVMSDDSSQSKETAVKIFEEYSRVLKNGGRYILITLAQDFILDKIMEFFSSRDWLIRLHKVFLVSEDSGQPELPVFAFVITKFKKLPKKIFEICDNENFKPRRVKSVDEIVEFVKSQQHYNMMKSHINKQIDAEREVQPIELYLTDDSSSPRFVLHVVDKLVSSKTNVSYAVFIVPQGREAEWMFCSDEGRKQLANQIPFHRILFVLLHRDHEYGSRKELQDELNANVMDFAPPGLLKEADVPYLSTGKDDLGQRVVRFKGESTLSGPYVVEDYIRDENHWYRHLTFTRRDEIIQCEMRLKGKGQKGRREEMMKEVAVPDMTYIASQYVEAFITGLATRYKPEDFFNLMIVGVGGGTLSSFLLKSFINCNISAVEIDPDLIEIGHKWFGLPRPEEETRLQIHIADGLRFPYEEQKRLTQDNEAKYDVIMLDVDVKDTRSGISCPPGEFLEENYLKTIWNILIPEGLFVVNLLCRSDKIKKKVMYNLRSCFKFIATFECTPYKNQVVFCFKEKPKYEQTAQKKRKKKKKSRKNESNLDDTVSESKNTENSEITDSLVKKLREIDVSRVPAEAGCVEAPGGENMAGTKMREIPEAVEVMKMFVLSGEQDDNKLKPPRGKKTIPLMSFDRCLLHNCWEERCESWENVWLQEHGRKLIELREIVSGMMVEQEVEYYVPR